MEERELPQTWGKDEMKQLKSNEPIKKMLLDNGIVKYLCNCMLSEEDIGVLIRRVVTQRVKVVIFTPGAYKKEVYYFNRHRKSVPGFYKNFITEAFIEPQCFQKKKVRRLHEYLTLRLHSLSQVEFLQKMANALRVRDPVKISVQKKPSKKQLPEDFWEQDTKEFTLKRLEWKLASSVQENQRGIYYSFLRLPEPLKELARGSMKLKEHNLFEKGVSWVKKQRKK